MTVEHLILLAVVHGITEFLPVASPALLPPPGIAGAPGPGIALAVHAGTLGAVALYLWRDLARMLAGLGRALRGHRDPGARLALQLALATLPLLAAGYLAARHLGARSPSAEAIGWATLGFGVLLWIADRLGMTLRRVEHMSHGGAIVLGLSQVLALVPGAGRSCLAMTAARLLGFERLDAARVALLLAMPAITAAATLAGIEHWRTVDAGPAAPALVTAPALVAAALSFLAALAAIVLMMRWLRRASFLPFALCRILLGTALLAWHYQG